jgi:hypothetical protein
MMTRDDRRTVVSEAHRGDAMGSTSRRSRTFGSVLAILPLLTIACSPTQPGPTGAAVASPTGAAPSVAATSPRPTTAAVTPIPSAPPRNPAAYVQGEAYAPAFDPGRFDEGITNPFFPFPVGATFIFDGDEHVEVEVLDETKDILGIKATVVRDRVFEDCEVIEDTRDWYGQDTLGNVWYLGEQTAEYDHGKVTTTAGSWQAGVDGALPGIIMLASPQAGDIYRQEFLEGEAEDLGEVTAVTGSAHVPAGSWSGSDVLVTEEWTPLEPDVRERKIYARGLGVVRIKTIQGGRELTTLTSATLPGASAEPGAACGGD